MINNIGNKNKINLLSQGYIFKNASNKVLKIVIAKIENRVLLFLYKK